MDTGHTRDADDLRRIFAGVWLVGLLLSLVIGWSLVDSRRTSWSHAASTSTNLETALGREIARTIEAYDLSLQSAQRGLNTPAFPLLDPISRHQLLFDGAIEAKHMGSMYVFDTEGRIVYDSSGLMPRQISAADRDYFLVHKYHTATGLFISRPYRSRVTHEWSIGLSRRLVGPDGVFAGVVMGSVRFAYFAELFSKLDLGAGGTISLFSDRGVMLYKMPWKDSDPGRDFGATQLFQRLREGRLTPYEGTSQSTGDRMLFAAARIADLPLVLSVNLPTSTVYADWRVKAMMVGGALMVLLATGAILLRMLRTQQQARLLAETRALELSEQNRLDAERHHAGKMEAVGRLTAGVAHDFNNYLQTITSSLEIIATDYLDEPEARDIVHVAHGAATKGAKLTHRLLAFSRQQVLQPRRVNVAFLLSDMRKLVADAAVFDPQLRYEVGVDPFTDDLHVDATQVESCLLNLLLNGRDAMTQGGTLQLSARNAGSGDALFGSLMPGRHVILSIRDEGRGMDEETMRHAFDPFYTTKAFGKGAGLGLPMAQGFCRQSGGDIRIRANTGGPGTTVEVWLPAATPDVAADEEVQVNYATIGRRTGRILLVEDEHDVLVSLSAILISGGFEVVSVNNGAEGLMRLRDRETFDAVLTDYSMPDMSGADFLVRAAAVFPELPMLMLTGGDIDPVAMAGLPRPARLLRKPIRRMGLLNAVREAIGEQSVLVVS